MMIDQQVASRVAAYRGNPQALQQRYAMSQELIDLLALQKIKSEKEAAAREMQLKMAQQQAANGEAPATVAEQREKEVMDLTKQEIASQRGDLLQQQERQKQARMQQLMSGVANAPGARNVMTQQAMAAGGIVAFNGQDQSYVPRSPIAPSPFGGPAAGSPPKVSLSDEDERDILARIEAKIKEGTATPSEVRRANGIRARLLGNRAEPRGAAAPAAPATPAAAPTSPPYSDSDAAERADRMTGSVTPPPPPPPQNKPPQVRPPGPAAAAPAPAQAPTGIAALQTPAAPQMDPDVVAAMRADVGRDPFAQQKAEETRIANMLKLTPEQRAVMEKGISERERMMQEEFDPERQRRESITRFLVAGGGRRYGELGAGASASMDYEAKQREARKKAFEDLQKSREGLIGIDRESVKQGIEGGLKGLDAAQKLRAQGLATGASQFSTSGSIYSTGVNAVQKALDRESNERIARADVAVKREIAQAQREGTLEGRRQSLLNDINRIENQAIAALDRGPVAAAMKGLLEIRAMNPKAFTKSQQDELKRLETDYELARKTIEKQADDRRGELGGSGASGFKVEREK